ncbi:MAG: SMR family transporter [Pirellulaceae bacterium]|jgi:quaternary ammonium compound-resistance protein SugE|nr:SMR family transporter [Pirellulaceae bacterium]
MAWLLVVFAGLFEATWPPLLKLSETASRPGLMGAALGLGLCGLLLLKKATATLPIGTSYVVFTGIGAIGAVAAGILFFDESTHWSRLLFIALIVGGVIGLKVTSDV